MFTRCFTRSITAIVIMNMVAATVHAGLFDFFRRSREQSVKANKQLEFTANACGDLVAGLNADLDPAIMDQITQSGILEERMNAPVAEALAAYQEGQRLVFSISQVVQDVDKNHAQQDFENLQTLFSGMAMTMGELIVSNPSFQRYDVLVENKQQRDIFLDVALSNSALSFGTVRTIKRL